MAAKDQNTDERYWIAHVRGPTYQRLRELGFVVLYPAVDDYVFLEANDKNKKLLNKQTELCISFLKNKKGLTTIPKREVERMKRGSDRPEQKGRKVQVISGTCAGLEGEVLEHEEQRCLCKLKGFNRTYEIWVDRLHLVFMPEPTGEGL